MNTSCIQAHLFERVGGLVIGTADIEVARARMRQLIRETWEDFGPDPWQLYDFTHRQPTVDRGYPVEDPMDPQFCNWVSAHDGDDAVIWR